MSTKGHISTFSQGMDKDTAHQKYSNMKYEHAENLRLMTDDGLTTGAMINIEGTEKLIAIPTLYTLTADVSPGYNGTVSGISFLAPDGSIVWLSNIRVTSDTTIEIEDVTLAAIANSDITIAFVAGLAAGFIIPEGYTARDAGYNVINTMTTDPYIIGSTTLRDSIILFTTDNTTKVGGEGQIWKIDYDDSTLDATTELIFAGALNMSTQHLVEAVGRYETKEIQRLYWTDNFNAVRSVNAVDPNRFNTTVNLLALNAEVTVIPGRFTNIGEKGSGNLDIGTYQVSYRLQTRGGITTVLSPWSVPISVNASDESVEQWSYQRGDHTLGSSTANKTLTFEIDEFPEGYDYVEIFLLKRGVSEGILYKVDTATLASTNKFDYKITGSEGEFEEIFSDDIENFNIVFDTAKTLTIKDNRLLLGNITEVSQVIDYDASAPRFKENGVSHANQIDGINPYNRDSTRNPSVFSQYKLKEGTKELGGKGANVSYTFTTRDIELDNVGYDTPTFPLYDAAKNTSSITINNIDYNTSSGSQLWNNYRNPYLEHLITGYQRSEVYRFGILFYDLYSRPMDVKWIGDIRMPEMYDSDVNSERDLTAIPKGETAAASGDAAGYATTKMKNNTLYGKVLGLNFKVDISDVEDKVSGFSIVRAPRPNKDKTILGQGVLGDVVRLKNGGIEGNINPYTVVTDTSFGDAYEEDDIGKYTDWLEDESVLVSAERLQTIDANRLAGVAIYDRVATFDSPQLLNGFGNPSLYGNIIGGEAQGLIGEFGNLDLRPCYGYYGGTNREVSTYNAQQDGVAGEDPKIARHYSSKFKWMATQYISTYMIKSYKQSLFKNPVDNSIKVDGAIRMNYHNDNFLLDSYTRTEKLNTPGESFNFYSIDVNSRNNNNSNNILLGLSKQFGELYDEAYPSSTGIKYYNSTNINHLNTLGANRRLVANLYRDHEGQYGGATKLDIERTTYISTGHYQKVEKGTSSYDAEVYGGDTFINLINRTNTYAGERVNAKEKGAVTNARLLSTSTRYQAGTFYAIESTVNMDMIYEKNFADYTTKEERINRAENETYNIYPKVNDKSLLEIYPYGASVDYKYDFLIDNTYKARLDRDLSSFQAEDYSKSFFSLDSNQIISTEFDNRIIASGAKINGETSDAWTVFKLNDSMDVDGHYGPINKLEVLNNNVIFFQDRGFGVVAVNPRSVITDAGGAQLELGTGDVLHDFDYVSTELGCKHQKAIQKSREAIYFFDANSRKFYRFRGKNEPLSDMKGMSAYFYNTFKGDILSNDNILSGPGFTTGYDPRYNEVLFTYRDGTFNEGSEFKALGEASSTSPSDDVIITLDNTGFASSASAALISLMFDSNSAVGISRTTNYISFDGGTTYTEIFNATKISNFSFSVPVSEMPSDYLPISLGGPLSYEVLIKSKSDTLLISEHKTLAYSEAIDAFAGFYSFTPDHYIMDGARLFSPNPGANKELWVHNQGTRCSFYGADPAPSILRMIVNPQGGNPKIFNNVEYLAQLRDTDGVDILDETFNNFKISNEYQESEKELIVYGNDLLNTDQMHARRRMRNWRMQIPRAGTEKARIRNPYSTMEFTYNNNADKKLTLNDIITYYTDVPM